MTLNVVQSAYINSKVKPIINARATENYFSVLAGIYAISDRSEEVLCFSTGVKCVPDIKLQRANGLILHDSHAEVLTLRAFNYLMLDLISQVNDGKNTTIIEKDPLSNLYRLRAGIKLHMYISELPCGDASLESFIENDSVPWDANLKNEDLLRGRSNYTQVGKVRTKPGRKDSLISYSKSCSDKLTVACIKGILNSAVQDLFCEQIYLTSIIIPEMTVSVDRCFNKRLTSQFKDLMKTKIEVSKSEQEFDQKLKECKLGMLRRPSNNEKAMELGIICIPMIDFAEVVTMGVKNGNNIKRVLKTQKGFSSLSRSALMDKRKQSGMQEPEARTYGQFKEQQKGYTKFKRAIKESLGDWGLSTVDDFDIM